MHHPNAKALYRSRNGKYVADLVGHNSTMAMDDGESPIGFRTLVKDKLKYVSDWKKDLDKVMEMTTKAEDTQRGKETQGGPKPGAP